MCDADADLAVDGAAAFDHLAGARRFQEAGAALEEAHRQDVQQILQFVDFSFCI